MSGMVIRIAEKSDLPAVLAIYAQPAIDAGELLEVDAAAELLERYELYPNYKLYVACIDEEIVGTFALLIMDNIAHMGQPSAILEDMAVAPDHQRQGIGRQIMSYAMARAKDAGCYKLTLSSAIHRTDSHEFYESLGLKCHGYSFAIETDA